MAITKTEGGQEYTESAYLVVPDPESPSTWKLRIEETPGNVTRAQLGRAAAALGPGYRGNRVDLTPEERRAAARKLISLYHKLDVPDDEIPDYLWGIADMKPKMSENTTEDGYIVREADVFQAGDYPDKGVSVTPEDLDRLAQTDEAPVRVEHGDIEIGKAYGFRRVGDWLKATIRVLPEAWALIERVGVKGVSIALSRDLSRIIEVSWVSRPRVAGAQLYSDGDAIVLNLSDRRQRSMSEETNTATAAPAAETLEALRSQIGALQEAIAKERAEREAERRAFQAERARIEVQSYVQAGKLPPACADTVAALLATDAQVRFGEDEKPVATLVRQLIEALPTFGAEPPVQNVQTTEEPELTPEAERVWARHFRDRDKTQFAKALNGMLTLSNGGTN